MNSSLAKPRVGIASILSLLVLTLMCAGLVSCSRRGADAPPGGPVDDSFNIIRTAFNGGVRVIAPAVAGAVDPAFAIGSGFDERVLAIAEANDGSGDVYVGGLFTSYDGASWNQIIRLNADGTRDAGFAFGTGFDFAHINAIAVATDGSGDIYVGGDFIGYDGVDSHNVVRLNADGTRDAAFDVGDGFDDDVEALVVATDGSGDVYFGGQFSMYDGTAANGILRLNADGTRDAGFATGAGLNAAAMSLALATDGSGDIYVGGVFDIYDGTFSPRFARLNADGTLDANFAIGGGFESVVSSIAVAQDGSGDIHVGGQFLGYQGVSSNFIIRLNEDGTRDAGFDIGTGFDDDVLSLATATDGSGDVYVAGKFSTYDGAGSRRIVRLNADGSRDTGFAVGTGFAAAPGSNDFVHALLAATDGSGDVYVGGQFTSYNGTEANSITRLEVARVWVGGNFVNINAAIGSNRIAVLESDASLDTSVALGTGFDFDVFALAPATDGSGDTYVGGSFQSYAGLGANHIIRLEADGTNDTGFDVGAGFNDFVLTIAPAADGSNAVYVGGFFTSYKSANANRITRLNANGTVDTGFSSGAGFDMEVHSIAPATDGSGDVYVGGSFSSYAGTGSNRIIRLNADGSRDAGFDVGSGFDGDVLAITPALDGSGAVYVGGRFTSYNGTGSSRIVRLGSDGTLDAAFFVGAGFDFDVAVITVAIDGSGDVHVGGDFVEYDGQNARRMVRLNSDGSIDANFFINGGFDARVLSIAPTPDDSGDVYVGGMFSSFNGASSTGIIRLDANGAVGSGFGNGQGLDDYVSAIVPAQDGSGDVFIGGDFSSYEGLGSNGLIRLHANGQRDSGFGVGTGFDGTVLELAPAMDGSGDVYVGGEFSTYDGTDSEGIIRLNADGTRDAGFVVGSGFNDPIEALALATDGSGDVYAGGDYSEYNGTSSFGIIRLNADGTPDSGFAIGSGFNGKVLAIALAEDGSGDVYVGGELYTYMGASMGHIIRLNADGSVDPAFAVGSGFDLKVTTIVAATDGSGDVYIGGKFTTFDGVNSKRIIRLNADGTRDAGFAIGQGFNSIVLAIALATDVPGDIYVAGDFTSYRGVNAARIIRLQSNGARAASFEMGSGFNSEVRDIAQAKDGTNDLYIGGAFTGYDGNQVEFAGALNPDGSLD